MKSSVKKTNMGVTNKKVTSKCTVVIPCRNDQGELIATIKSLVKYNDDVIDIIIVIDDASDAPLTMPVGDEFKKVVVYRQEYHQGVGAAFDLGVRFADTNSIFLMGCDIRFTDNHAIEEMIRCGDENPQSLIGCQCKGVTDAEEFTPDGRVFKSGAEILWKMTNKDLSETNPFYDDDMYRDILQAKWIMTPQVGITDIPCLLGATYAVQKSWYERILGFSGHRVWGGLEPYISLKSHMAGGGVKQMNGIITGHKFGRAINRRRDWNTYYYNKVFMAHMLFDGELKQELLKHVKVWKPAIDADREIRTKWHNGYDNLREYYKKMSVVDIRDTICWNSYPGN